MPSVLVCQGVVYRQPGEYARILQAAGFEIRYPEPGGGVLSEAELAANLAGVDATIASMERYSAEIIAAADRLRVISRCGVGLDSVDLEAATRHNIAVGITPGCNQESVAEHTMALLLAAAKRVVDNHALVAGGGFARKPTHSLRGKTLGIVGLGTIGREVARRARAFDMRLVTSTPSREPGHIDGEGVRSLELDELWREADYITLHAPLNSGTNHLIRTETIARMKNGVILVNTSRGGLVDEHALAEALRSGKVAAAAVDVYANEPPADSPLLSAPNVVFSPHLGGADQEAFEGMVTIAAQNIVDLYQGRWPAERVANAVGLTRPWHWET